MEFTHDNRLRIRPDAGKGLYLEIINCGGIEIGLGIAVTPNFCVYLVLPYLRVEFGWCNVEQSRLIEKFFSPLTDEEKKRGGRRRD